MAKEKNKNTREQLKKEILCCLKTIEGDVENILDRLMSNCCGAYLKININPICNISYEEHHEHFPKYEYMDIDRKQGENNGETSKL